MRLFVSLMLTATVILLLSIHAVAMEPLPREQTLRNLAVTAASEDEAAATEARARLRAAGPSALKAMQLQFAPEIARAMEGHLTLDDPTWRRIHDALDCVSAQRDDYTSGLFWYTDFEQAEAAAARSGKPILSLRLLGTLDSEMSCANSRFFRTTLYANERVSAYLRDHFVLHWKSVRPVPHVTIDMGDGRVIHRTITGNSIHYVLDAEGRPIEAIPGLYGPDAFLRAVSAADIAEQSLRGVKGEERANKLAQWHLQCIAVCDAAWGEDLRALGVSASALAAPQAPAVNPPASAAPPANAAARLAVGKRAGEAKLVNAVAPADPPAAPPANVAAQRATAKCDAEAPLVKRIVGPPGTTPQPDLAGVTTSELWPRIAELHAPEAKLDDGSRRLMRSKLPNARAAGAAALTKRRVEDPLVRTIANFERSVAEDTVRNEYTFHRTIHVWFARHAEETKAVDVLNKRVYAELFLTPDSDPWLGLVPADTYTALQDDGMSESCFK